MPRNALTKRRKQILFLILAAGVIFITFQIFSLSALNISSRISALRAMDEDGEVNMKLVRGNRHRRDPSIEEFDQHVYVDIEQGKEPEAKKLENHDVKFERAHLPRGVHRTDAQYYTPIQGNMFLCLSKEKNIPFSQVNDDYCDCDDGSDEPGTSACVQGRFFCSVQLPDQLPQSVPSGRVNDGLCDCCDGSDEWEGLSPPSGVIQAASKTAAILTAPCQNLCEKVVERKEDDKRIKQLGRRHRQEYLRVAAHLTDKEKKEFGPDGIFFKLSQSCFTFKSSGYEYTVCPFKSVKQQHFPQASKSLGERPVWSYMSDGLYILNMEDGSSHLCPNESRKSIISFLCGITDRVISIQEDEKCVYSVKFATPAAC